MNELDLTTKIEGLKKAIAEHNDFAGTYEGELAKAEQQLKDLGKIALPPIVFDDIQEAIERGVDNFDFSDTDKYGKEFGLDYDGRVMLDSLELNDTYELIEGIVERVHKLFTEMECPEEDDNHPVEKLQN
jgi:hypothetical protein